MTTLQRTEDRTKKCRGAFKRVYFTRKKQWRKNVKPKPMHACVQWWTERSEKGTEENQTSKNVELCM